MKGRSRAAMVRTERRLSLLVLGLLAAVPAVHAANCATAFPNDGATYFLSSGWNSLGSADTTALEALFALSSSIPLPSGLQQLAGASLCCAQDSDAPDEWSVAAITDDADICGSYQPALTAPCILKHRHDAAFPLFHQLDNWHISCSNPGAGDGFVEKLELPSANLDGMLPEEVGSFDRLEKLDLQNNRLTSVHTGISDLDALEIANFDNAFVAGASMTMHELLTLMVDITPSGGGADSTLQELRASGNSLEGSFPANFGSDMGALKILELKSNLMTGTLPTTLSQMSSSLVEMRLTGNSISGIIPDDINMLERLTDLELDDNRLQGTIPEFVRNATACATDAATCSGLKRLRTLKLGENLLSGTIPDSIEFAESLNVLHLGSDGSRNQHLSGTVPSGISELPLKEIDVSRNPRLTGTFPTNMLAGVNALFTRAVFSNCGFTGHLDELLTSIPTGYVRRHVQVLDFTANALSGTIPAIIGEFEALTKMQFENNMFSGEVPNEIGSLHRVGELSLGNNNFEGKVPDLCSTPNEDPDLADCMTHLEIIDFEDNKFNGFFRGIHSLSALHTINAVNNNFVAIASLPTSLQKLRLDDNNFYEDISRLEFTAEMVDLATISISNNRFLGDLAAAVAPLSGLEQLDASRNEFSGNFPAFTSNALKEINLHSNLIDGVIPETFICDIDRTQIELKITAYNNRITGNWPTCPEEPGWFSSAQVKLVLHSNQLTGSFFSNTDPILPHVVELDLSSNAISSAALNWIPQLTSVTELLISGANIAGDISPFFAAIPDDSLQILDLSSNGLTGTLDGLGAAIHLQDLILSNNSLAGTLDTLGEIFSSGSRNLSTAGTITIRLDNNQFTGSVDFLLDNVASAHVDHLDLSNNQLSAQLPTDMSALPIRFFLVDGNQFSGPIPILPPACHDPFGASNNQDAAVCLVDVNLGAQTGDGWDCPAPSTPPGLEARPWVNYVYHTASCTCRLGKFSDSSEIDCNDDPAWNSGYGGCADYAATASGTLHDNCAAHGADAACPVACETCTDGTTPSYRYANNLGPSNEEVRAFCTDAKPGFFSDEINSYKHEPCAIGHWTADSGRSSCDNCPAGKHGLLLSEMDVDGCGAFPDSYTAPCTLDIACANCDMGRYQHLEAQATCDACIEGKVGILEGQADEVLACECCQPGHYSNVPASLECQRSEPAYHVSDACQANQSRCEAALYQNLHAQAECKTCRPGYEASASQTDCDMCGVGFESSLGQFCSSCRNGTFSDQPGVAECNLSPPGHYVPPPTIEASLSDVSFVVTFFGGVAQQEGLDTLQNTFINVLLSNADYLNGKEPTGCGQNVASHQVTICVNGVTTVERNRLQAAIPSMMMTGGGRRRAQDTHVDAISPTLSVSRREIRVRWESVQHRFLNDPAITHSSMDAIDTVSARLRDAGFELTEPLIVEDIHQFDETEGVTIEAIFGADVPDETFVTVLVTTIGATNQVACPEGTVQPHPGQDVCYPCSLGTIPNEYQTDCEPCPLGHFGPDGIVCDECHIGHFANITGMAECLPAHPGSFVDYMGAAFPTRCEELWYQDDYGQDECKMCLPGMQATADATACDPCAPGTYEPLPEGYTDSNHACFAGAMPTCRTLQCQPCEPGTYEANRGSTECDLAGVGRFVSEAGAVNHTLCDVTLYQDEEGQTECKQCARGHEPNSGWIRTSCTECDAGRASSNGFKCDLCPVGRFETDTASIECDKASLGHFVDLDGQTRQLPCPDGSVGLTYGLAICEPCQPGYESTGNHTECTSCAAGRAGYKRCLSQDDLDEYGRCPQEDAPGGYTTVHGASATQFCEECRPGSYGKYRGTVSCTLASLGHFVAGVGATDENDCQLGTVATEIGTISCETCGEGTIPNNDRTACVPCDAGRYSLNGTACLLCDRGRYQTSQGSSFCTATDEGYYAPHTGMTNQIICPLGTYSSERGQAECAFCQPGEGPQPPSPHPPIRCDECLLGTYSADGGECIPCDHGYIPTLSRASTNCTDIDECDPLMGPAVTCSILATQDCWNYDGGYSCGPMPGNEGYDPDGPCPVGYYGDGKGEFGCKDLDECLAKPCDEPKICSDSTVDPDSIAIGEYKCTDPNAALIAAGAIAGLGVCLLLVIGFFHKRSEDAREKEYILEDLEMQKVRSERKKARKAKTKTSRNSDDQSCSDSTSSSGSESASGSSSGSGSDSDGDGDQSAPEKPAVPPTTPTEIPEATPPELPTLPADSEISRASGHRRHHHHRKNP